MKTFDRRAAFFLVAALLCLALIPIAESDSAWVCVALTVVYVLLAVASYLDARTRARIEQPSVVFARAASSTGRAPDF